MFSPHCVKKFYERRRYTLLLFLYAIRKFAIRIKMCVCVCVYVYVCVCVGVAARKKKFFFFFLLFGKEQPSGEQARAYT